MKKIIIMGIMALLLLSIVIAADIDRAVINKHYKINHTFSDNKSYELTFLSNEYFCILNNCSQKSYTEYIEKDLYEFDEKINRTLTNLSGKSRPVRELTCPHEDRITLLETKVAYLGSILNITEDPIQTPLYYCSYRGPEECPGGISKPNKEALSTRCYNPFMIGWKVCDTGWYLP